MDILICDLPYFKTGLLKHRWKPGDTCKAVNVERISAPTLSMDKPPPPLPETPKDHQPADIVQVPPFDIQEIPAAMRRENMPIAAKLMERWFSGALNYAPTSAQLKAEINQDNAPYPPSMYDSTTVTMNWALGFERAKKEYTNLVEKAIYSFPAVEVLKSILRNYRHMMTSFDTWSLCNGSMSLLHKHFQFQRAAVGSTLSQKIGEFIGSQFQNNGAPDDMTAALGAFVFYAAPAEVRIGVFGAEAEISSIYVYIKDSYDFTDGAEGLSQYLGHWSRKGVIVVPYDGVMDALNISSFYYPYPVARGDMRERGNIFYPVHNKDFRQWALRHNRGGDFIFFSDRKYVRLQNPIKVIL